MIFLQFPKVMNFLSLANKCKYIENPPKIENLAELRCYINVST